MTGQPTVVAAEVPFPPTVEDFYLPSIVPWGEHGAWFTKITLLLWLTVAILIVFFLATYRNPQLVPTKKQWLAESIYGFVRNNIATEMIYLGFKRHGIGYIKHALVPPAPWFILPILVPIEFFSNFIVRPFSLAVRLFANMFAGHMLLLVFTLGGFAMINSNALLAPVSVLSWLMTIALTFLDFAVIALQAYVFTVLTASYVQGSLAEGH